MIQGIYQEKQDCQQKLYFKLQPSSSSVDSTELVVVDEHGDRVFRGTVLSIDNKTGAVQLHTAVSDVTGFSLRGNGMVMMEQYY